MRHQYNRPVNIRGHNEIKLRNHTRRKKEISLGFRTALDNSCRIKWKNLVSLPKNGPIWLKSERRLVQLVKVNSTREKFCSGPVWMGFIYCCLKVKKNLSSCSITVRLDNGFLLKDNWSFWLNTSDNPSRRWWIIKLYNGEAQFNNFCLKDHTYLEALELPYDITA